MKTGIIEDDETYLDSPLLAIGTAIAALGVALARDHDCRCGDFNSSLSFIRARE